MKPLGALPVLKVAGVMAVAVAFAGAIALGASRDNGPRDFAPTPNKTV